MIEKLKPIGPYLAAIAFFIIISIIYFSPILEGRQLPQMDNTHAIGMAKELVNLEKDTGDKAQWTNSMFGGMPAYQIKADASANVFGYMNRLSRLGLPFHTVAIVFLYLLGFFLLLRSMGFSHWLSIAGAVAFAFGSYNFIIIIAGHITKAYAIALMAPVLAGIIYAYNKNKWGGALFTAVALGAEIAYNHVQITYYLAILVFILVLDRLIRAIVNGTIKDFGNRTALLAVGALLAILPNITGLWTTYEYGKYSIRGKSELQIEANKEIKSEDGDNAENNKKPRATGLDPKYAFDWSYGKMETFTLLVPNLMGGASDPISSNSDVMANVDERLKTIVGEQSQYWGSKPFTSGPVYVGAIVFFLFVLAIFFYKGREKWWLLAGTFISIILAWGYNLEWFNMLMFDYFPLYNKFRTVEMALVIATVTIPLLAMLGLKQIVENPSVIKEKSSYFLSALFLSGGVALVFYLFPTMFFDFMSTQELEALGAQKLSTPEQAGTIDLFIQEIQGARIAMLKADAFRSLVFIILGSASIWFFTTGKLTQKYLVPGLLILVLIDLWGVDKRYIDNSNFVPARQLRQQFTQTQADKEILKDKDPNYRVFAIYRNPFTEVNTSYFHKSLGGYHGAKLQRYQDLIDNYLVKDYSTMMSSLQQTGSLDGFEDLLSTLPVVNMLNTRYIIIHPEMAPVTNPYAMGNAWFVNDVKVVTSVKEELESLKLVDLSQKAIIHSDFSDKLSEITIGAEGGTIELTKYHPDKLEYVANVGSPQLVVFSEIYYPAGWKAYINGKRVPVLRANYILRALSIPAGESIIEFKFEPVSYRVGKIIAVLGSVILLGLIVWFLYKRKDVVECHEEATE